MRLVMFFLGLGLLVVATNARAIDVPITEVSTNINTANEDPEIWVEVWVDKTIDGDATTSRMVTDGISAELVNAATAASLGALTIGATDDRVTFKVDDPNADLAREIAAKSLALFVALSSDLTLVFEDGSTGAITPARMKELSSEIGLESEDAEALAAVARGQQRVYEDKIDFAREVDEEDSSKVDYALSFRLHQSIANLPLWFETRGRMSTNQDNPLNQVGFALVSRTGIREATVGEPIFYSFFLQAGVTGTQTFDTASAVVDAGIDVLLPNLLDLTGGANRLRLKPVANASFGYRRLSEDLELFGNDRDCLEFNVEIAYVVPILDKYSLDVNSRATFNDDAEGDSWFHQTAASLAYELPTEDVKVLAKWEIGRNGFSSEEDSKLLLGVLADYLPF